MKSLLMLSGLGVLALLAELFNFKKWLFPLVIVGLLLTIGVSVKDWNSNIHLYNNMLLLDNFALLYGILLCAATALWFTLFSSYIDRETSVSDFYALALFALTGAFVMVSFHNLVMLFLGIEIMSLSVYVLAGSRKFDHGSNEAALKYFIMGSFATGFLLFGVALIYGTTGSFHLDFIGSYVNEYKGSLPPLFITGVLLMCVGMAFKISAVPFHFWAPDVYTGAPVPVTAYMATIVKSAAFVAFMRLFYMAFGSMPNSWISVVSVLSVLSMFIGNITALFQKSVKRVLAYSGIAHAGYLLIGLLALSNSSNSAVFYYLIAYLISSLVAFSIIHELSGNNAQAEFNIFNGLVKRNKLMAFTLAAALFSMAGIPPLAGFMGKYLIFSSAIDAGRYKLVLLAVIASIVSIYYYFKPVIAAFFSKPDDEKPIELSINQKLVYSIALVILIGLSILPDFILRLF